MGLGHGGSASLLSWDVLKRRNAALCFDAFYEWRDDFRFCFVRCRCFMRSRFDLWDTNDAENLGSLSIISFLRTVGLSFKCYDWMCRTGEAWLALNILFCAVECLDTYRSKSKLERTRGAPARAATTSQYINAEFNFAYHVNLLSVERYDT